MEVDQRRFRLAPDVTFQSMGPEDQTVVLSLESGYLYTCNETTASFLQALDGRRTFREIIDVLAGQYDVSPQQLEADLGDLTEELLREKLIAIDDPATSDWL